MVVLIVNSDSNETERMAASVREIGLPALTAHNLRSGGRLLRERTPGLVFAEMNGDRAALFDFLQSANSLADPPPVVVMARRARAEDAAEVMKRGAHDFWIKPVDSQRFQKTLELLRQAQADPPAAAPAGDIITRDEVMERLKAVARRVAPSSAAVFIQGESGTGKELFARYIHRHSPRSDKPFIAVNCAALPENLLESELFGHEKGAFTGASRTKKGKFELAQGGTLLLDEITEIPLHLQAKLLRVLQEGEVDRVGGQYPIAVDVRVIATSNVDVPKSVKEGRFRSDLYYRLNVIPLRIPPLRKRVGDIAILCEHFIRKHAADGASAPRKVKLSASALDLLQRHDWPGNVRELENVIHRAVLLSDGPKIDGDVLFLEEMNEDGGAGSDIELMSVEEMERRLIHKALKSYDGNRTRAAEILGISVRTLRNKLQAYRASGSLEAGL